MAKKTHQRLLGQFIRQYDHLFIWAALATVPIFIIETYLHPGYFLYITLEIISWTIWALFLAELLIKWYIWERSTTHFIRNNFISILILILPLIRALRFIKVVHVERAVQQMETVAAFKDIRKLLDLRRIFGA